MVAGMRHWDAGGGGRWKAGWMKLTTAHILGVDYGPDKTERGVGDDSP